MERAARDWGFETEPLVFDGPLSEVATLEEASIEQTVRLTGAVCEQLDAGRIVLGVDQGIEELPVIFEFKGGVFTALLARGFILQRCDTCRKVPLTTPLYYAPRAEGPQWTEDEKQALTFARLLDAESFVATLPDITSVEVVEVEIGRTAP